MAKYDIKRSSARASGRPLIPEFTIATGANINTNIAVSGINKEDGLLAVLREVAGVLTDDLVAEAKVTSTGNIQVTSTNATGNKLLVIWLKVRPSGS